MRSPHATLPRALFSLFLVLGGRHPLIAADADCVQDPAVLVPSFPAFPEVAKAARLDGTVTLDLTVGGDGHVTQVSVVTGNPLLNEPASRAAMAWVFERGAESRGVRLSFAFVLTDSEPAGASFTGPYSIRISEPTPAPVTTTIVDCFFGIDGQVLVPPAPRSGVAHSRIEVASAHPSGTRPGRPFRGATVTVFFVDPDGTRRHPERPADSATTDAQGRFHTFWGWDCADHDVEIVVQKPGYQETGTRLRIHRSENFAAVDLALN